MRLTFTIEFTRDDPEPEPEREVDMVSQVELGPQSRGFSHPMHEEPPYQGGRTTQ